MAQYDNRYAHAGSSARTGVVVDEGLRAYMLSVYNYMAAGVALTGLTAYVTQMMAVAGPRVGGQLALTPFGEMLYLSPLKWVAMLAPLALVFLLSFRVYRMSLAGAQMAFWAFAALMGVSLSSIFLVYTGQSITRVFFITAAAFAALSLYGYTTKQDLSGWGSFLIMGVIGILIAGLVNLWLASNALQFAISVIGVLVFAGLTAYDTQQIKDNYYAVVGDASLAAKTAIMGALNLYLDFINMFVSMLRLFGERE
jgi:FtsH-binding integral membrane protein